MVRANNNNNSSSGSSSRERGTESREPLNQPDSQPSDCPKPPERVTVTLEDAGLGLWIIKGLAECKLMRRLGLSVSELN
ncbi:hypothetical protein scyTo_0022987, partial [Scyliorhinus torazame]|nr:hypothetical protein [Scyliorhinus torazame]